MHLKSISMKGFKSFPERTRLDFAPGVSVIVGPNGCGKSNITDAVLWALGEQSPLAVRGQTMQDVIYAGGQGQSRRKSAEVEVVIDNSDGRAPSEFSEISVKRRLDRSGDGGYWLNGARCRLADVVEALADTNLGREMHSVISQGRVEEIVHSKPRHRRLLVEEAAGLGKHRKRRRRAQLKLERTQDNLDRALDVEREARLEGEAPLRRAARPGRQLAAVERHALAHADEPVPAAVGRRVVPPAVVGHLEAQLARAVLQAHRRARRAGVPEGVGQALLHDPVGGQVDAGRQRPGLPPDRDGHRQTGVAHVPDEVVEARETRLGGERRVLVGALAERPEHPPQLAERLPPRVLHGGDRAPRPLGVGVEHRLGGLGLHDHHAQAVGHDVVHLPRDAGALLGHRRARLDVALALQALGALAQPRGALGVGAGAVADQPCDAEDGDHREEVGPASVGVALDHHHHRDEEARGPRHARPYPPQRRAVEARRDRHDHEAAERVGHRLRPDQRLGQDAGDRRRGREDREPAARQQRQAPHQAERDQGERLALDVGHDQHLGDPDPEEQDDHGVQPVALGDGPRPHGPTVHRGGAGGVGRAEGRPHPRG